MRILFTVLILAVCGPIGTPAQAGDGRRNQSANPPSPPRQLVAPNGVITPTWATRRLESSPVPLYGQSWGRRPWAFPLAQQATASANMARADQLGYGAGPIPGYTNGPPLGNYPVAPIGNRSSADRKRGYGPSFGPGSGYPYSTYLNGN